MVDRDCAVLLTVDMHFPGVKLLPGFCWVFARENMGASN
jgi:hypothetical protein